VIKMDRAYVISHKVIVEGQIARRAGAWIERSYILRRRCPSLLPGRWFFPCLDRVLSSSLLPDQVTYPLG